MSLALNGNVWAYNIVTGRRNNGFYGNRNRLHADEWLGICNKSDPIFPGFRTTHRFMYVRLECGFLGAKSADGPPPYIFVFAVAQPRPIIVHTSQSQSIMKAKLNRSEKIIDKDRGCSSRSGLHLRQLLIEIPKRYFGLFQRMMDGARVP